MLDKINEVKAKLQNLNNEKIRFETERKFLEEEKKEIVSELQELNMTVPELINKILSLRETIAHDIDAVTTPRKN